MISVTLVGTQGLDADVEDRVGRTVGVEVIESSQII